MTGAQSRSRFSRGLRITGILVRGWGMGCAVPKALLSAILFVSITGCVTVPDQRWEMLSAEDPGKPGNAGPIQILQINEGSASKGGASEVLGGIFQEADYRNVQQWIRESPESPLIVYVHGWHHNAETDNSNLISFRRLVGEIESDLCLRKLKLAVEAACPQVKGLYIGWRGESWDLLLLDDILDFPTFNARKEASRRIGEGALRRVLVEIERDTAGRDVVFAGHSLGANAVYHAIKGIQPLVVDDRHEYFLLNPAISSSEFSDMEKAILTAVAARRSEMQASGVDVSLLPRDHRKLMVLQGQNDFVVKHIYSVPHGTAIGFDEGRRTHLASATPIEGTQCPAPSTEPLDPCRIALGSGMLIRPKNASAPEQCEAAFNGATWVVSADKAVADGHGGIWDITTRCSLVELITRRMSDTDRP